MADTISSGVNCQSAGGVVYLLIDGTNDFEYVGQTTRSAEERFKEHAKADSYIGNVIRAHGADMFVVVVLKICHSKEELDYWERRLIKSRNTKAPFGYNCTDGGEGIVGCAEITREKMRKANRGENNPNYGKASVRRCRSPYKNLIAELEARKLNYTAFAKLLGLSIAAISMRLSGKKKFTARDAA
ncbi:MAG: GIY-YIG nuclease family protein [Selenomonadaceae bacterium]|nr:GIY-YIG nuclease family protein [Selenomonadaceae bacterium]